MAAESTFDCCSSTPIEKVADGILRSCLLHRFVKNEWRVLTSQTIGVEFASKIIRVGTGARRKRIKLQVRISFQSHSLDTEELSSGTRQEQNAFARSHDHTIEALLVLCLYMT